MKSSTEQSTGRQPKMTLARAKRSVPDGSLIASLVVFPTTEHFSGAEFPRHIRSVAFLRLVDGTIWMLAIQGKSWTDQQLMAAAETLSSVSANVYTKSSIERLLRQELEIASVSLESPVLGSVDLRQWSVRETAYVMFKRHADKRTGFSFAKSGAGLRISTTEETLIDDLGEALEDFVEGFEPKALEISSANGQFNHRLYNYLAHSSYHLFRLQFAETFPSLLLTSVLAEQGSLGAELRSIVDSGAPIIKGLAGRWNVRPVVVRHLIGKSSGHVGIRWSRDAMGLAVTLNALITEDLPGDADSWGEFNRMVAVGQQLFGRNIWESAAALEWLKECMNRYKRGTKTALNTWLPNWGKVSGIVRFRNALTASLKRESTDSRSCSANEVENTVVEAVDSLILRMASLDLAELASQYDDELDVAIRGSGASKVAPGETMLPLFPGEFISGDRARIVRPLTTQMQLKKHGIELKNCLAHSSMQYIRKGSKGTNYVVGVLDKETGKPLSTAEIAVRRRKGAERYLFIVRQHTAKKNTIASRQCSRAIVELIRFCRTDEVRQFLEHNWKQVRHASYNVNRYAWNPVLEAMVTKALRRTITDAIYEELLASIRNKSGAVDTA